MVLVAGVICASLIAWIVIRPTRRAVPEPEQVIPPEQRHDYLDVTVVKGLRYRYPGRGWDVRVGSVEIRRRSFGFIRIGAFNEALITDLHVTLTPEFRASEVIALLQSMGGAPAVEGASSAIAPVSLHPAGPIGHTGSDIGRRGEGAHGAQPERHPRQIGFFLEQLGVRSPHADTRVSGIRVRNMSLRFAPGNDKPDVVYLRTSSASIRSGEVRLGGLIEFGAPDGRQIRCREARLSLEDTPTISVREAVLYSGAITQAVDRLSFPLSALLAGEDLLNYTD